MLKSSKFQDIIRNYHENKLSHAFLLETNDVDSCYKDVLELIKVLNCPQDYTENCNECNLCNLIEKNNLPSLITIEADGTYIKKDQILNMMDRFKSVPVFSKFNIYIIKNCDRFNSSSANTILKFLEEPEDNILGFFITNNKVNVISTIRSRCQEYSILYDNESFIMYSNEDIIAIEDYFKEIYSNDNIILYNRNQMKNKFSDRLKWNTFFTNVFYYLNDLLYKRVDSSLEVFQKISEQNMIAIILLVEDVLKYIKSNGNIDLILDKFAIKVRDLCE